MILREVRIYGFEMVYILDLLLCEMIICTYSNMISEVYNLNSPRLWLGLTTDHSDRFLGGSMLLCGRVKDTSIYNLYIPYQRISPCGKHVLHMFNPQATDTNHDQPKRTSQMACNYRVCGT